MAKVLITPATLKNLGGPYLETLREAGFELIYAPQNAQLLEDEVLVELRGVSAVLAGSEPYTRRVLEAHPTLRVIARAGVGYDAVDVPTATERGIAVATTPGTNHDSVAEHTFAILFGLAKKVVDQHVRIRSGEWPRHATLPLRGRVLGIAGLGRIGKSVAIRASAFGMKLLAYEPYPDEAFVRQYNIGLVSFDRLLAESDYLTLHLPLVAESRHLMNRKTLAQMKRGAILVNTARGGLVNEADLYESLRSGHLGGAALDVFEEEPPGKKPLFELENVVLTAHTAGVDTQSRDDMALHAARAIVALSRGEWPAHQIVNPEVRAKFRWS